MRLYLAGRFFFRYHVGIMLSNPKKKGFTLVELMIAIAVILIGLFGVTNSLVFGLSATHHGTMLSEASSHCRTLLETATGRDYISLTPPSQLDGDNMPSAASGLNDADDDRTPIDAAPFEAVFLTNADIRPFMRNIQTVRKGPVGTPEGELAIMTVTVFWNEKGVEKRVRMSGVIPHTL